LALNFPPSSEWGLSPSWPPIGRGDLRRFMVIT
jgi:hypothetical protein